MRKNIVVDSNKISFDDLQKISDAVVLVNGNFVNIRGISGIHVAYTNNYVIKSKYLYTPFLIPHTKGTVKQYGRTDVPFFVYDTKRLRKDVPKKLTNGDNYLDIKTNTINGLLNSNLVGNIVQYNNDSSMGGTIVFDSGSIVVVKLKDGNFTSIDKLNLFYKKLYKNKSNKKVIWFIFDVNKELPRIEPKKMKPKDALSKYIDTLNSLKAYQDNKDEYSDDFSVYNNKNTLIQRQNELWGFLNSREKKTIEFYKKKHNIK